MVHRQSVLALYKELLKYGKTLKHTDKDYYMKRVREEFVKNKDLPEDKIPYSIKQGRVFLMSRNVFIKKSKLDFSRVPTLNEKDLEESFMRGDGPGGQAVQKTANCVQLRHLPTNIVVKYHGTRILSRNREEARKILINKLDEYYNKEMSVENQKKRLEKEKSLKRQSKNDKLRKLKIEFKKSLEEIKEEVK
ncbi:hypothetical protein PVAND_008868 [Polypedilum vanderplanki]|uniref:Prokaryotic-type class I peptide chain release factors domain-containing protein n=1 Tax=Polypedilum vanderplanki TaxID=319348 RepID=A0A9J6CB49_POLVA|nr:hypothetical protein PVAND_008868 [Polypedilum vanderplanki]